MFNYTIEDLVTVAKRENNSKRPYLYVNPIQGKHIPVDPNKPIELFTQMGRILDEKYPNEQLLIIGFAETATAIGAGIACSAKNVKWCMQTTREKYNDANYLFFTESHSHATEQSLIINDFSKVIQAADRIVFAEDEVTTGNTIVKLITAIQEKYPDENIKYSIFSILNSMTGKREEELKSQGIECLYIEKIPFEYKIQLIDQYEYCENCNNVLDYKREYDAFATNCLNLRYVHSSHDYKEAVELYVNTVVTRYDWEGKNKILILGTEEFMFPPMMVAKKLKEMCPTAEVIFHATTRSPILVSDSEGYPLTKRNQLLSFYDRERITYIYNLKDYDIAVVLSDSCKVSEDAEENICSALNSAGCKQIIIGKGKG